MGTYGLYHDASRPKHRGQDGRGNLRVAKTPPLQSGVCGAGIAIQIGHYRLHAHFLHPTCPHEPVVLKRRGTPHWLGRALASGRATFGPPLQHLPYQERNSQSRQLIENAIHVNDAACRVVTVTEKWDCVIKTVLPSRRGKPPIKD